ncbi:putative 3-hydroxyisobutyrate dehydrogenase, mitochondrial [Vitis vinifera]|uniref:3-hydroxyisobutyrate dehydrogenase n=1 Tax=Vitis vinifera TaxID=29760 RepID=A0A438HAM3_VITVI|nr:putative 3-hydroxyisobutyrate dehydrogenase, mitochondrial [Vitis vinifera]
MIFTWCAMPIDFVDMLDFILLQFYKLTTYTLCRYLGDPHNFGCPCIWRCSCCRNWDTYFHGLVLVGGSEEAYLAAKPLFLSMGKNTIYCGGAGNGSAAKICNNLAMAVSMLGVSEAFALGQSLGIAAGTLAKIFNSSSARCWSSDSYNPVPGVMEGVPSSRNYVGGFATKLMVSRFSYFASRIIFFAYNI